MPWIPPRVLAGLALLILAGGCTSSPSDDRPELLAVSLPDLSRTDPAVQAQLRERYEKMVRTREDVKASAAELGTTYGDLGMVLQAAEYYDAAEPCYLNAQALVPSEVRWPYFLGHLYLDRGQLSKAEASFRRALDLRPGEIATQIRLGRLYLDQGRPEAAEPLFAKALAAQPRLVAARAGLGRVALARRDYDAAVGHLEEALKIDPQADSLHSPLATAYRALGQPDKAEPHIRQWRNRDLFVPDPLYQELDLVLESGLSYELRGIRALEIGDWPAAAGFFRKGAALAQQGTPLHRSLQHKLGTALYMMGDVQAATEQFEAVVDEAPAEGLDEGSARAHYSLGVLMLSDDRRQIGIEHLQAAVRYQPSYAEAHVALADALLRSGRAKESLAHYSETVRIDPLAMEARFRYAAALVRLRRYEEARDWLAESMKLHPAQHHFAIALARVLAAAPDDRVRDGRRALELVQELYKGEKTTELGATMAMVFAELGDYEQARVVQREVLSAARRAGQADILLRSMEANLRLYERNQPCRTPWTDEEPFLGPMTPEPAPATSRSR